MCVEYGGLMVLYAIQGVMRFKDKIERDLLVTKIKNLKGKMIQSSMSIHRCKHDKIPFEPCDEVEVIV